MTFTIPSLYGADHRQVPCKKHAQAYDDKGVAPPEQNL